MAVGGLALLTLVAGRAAAQSDSMAPAGPVVAGTRVRVWEHVTSAVSMPVVGSVARVTSDSISLVADGLTAPVGIAWPSITRVEVSAGPRSGSRSTSAITGGIIGALGGAVLGVIAGNVASHNAATFGVVGGVVGAGVGAGVGAYMPGERWSPAALSHATPSP